MGNHGASAFFCISFGTGAVKQDHGKALAPFLKSQRPTCFLGRSLSVKPGSVGPAMARCPNHQIDRLLRLFLEIHPLALLANAG